MKTMNACSLPFYEAVLEFLVTGPSPQAIIAYRLPEEAQHRLSKLLEANRHGTLTVEEEEELDHYIQIVQTWLRRSCGSL